MFSILLNIYINLFAAGSRQDYKLFVCDSNKQSTLLIKNFRNCNSQNDTLNQLCSDTLSRIKILLK